MRRNFTRGLMLSAMALAGLGATGTARANVKTDNAVTINANAKATTPEKKKRGAIGVNNSGGLDLPPIFPKQFGMTPKEYGMRFGNGGSKRLNRLRLSHNAKLKRRKKA